VRAWKVVGVFRGADGLLYRYPNGDEVKYLCVLFEGEIVGGESDRTDDETLHLEYFEADRVLEWPIRLNEDYTVMRTRAATGD
jgi:hypothetical protein